MNLAMASATSSGRWAATHGTHRTWDVADKRLGATLGTRKTTTRQILWAEAGSDQR